MAYYNNYQMPNTYAGIAQPIYQASPQVQNQGNIVWVQGRTSAEIYPIAPGNKLMLMDSNEPVIYVKEADTTGKLYPMKIFDLVERKEKVIPTKEVVEPSVDYDKIKEMIVKADLIDYDKIKEMITTEVCNQMDNLTVSAKTTTSKKGDK